MTNKTNSAQDQELNDLRKKIEWFDNERRTMSRNLTKLEQKTTLQEREIAGREKRIQDLERQVAAVETQLTRIPRVDAQLSQFNDEVVQLIEQYDQRRIQSESEMDRLRRVEHESIIREIADMRKEFPAITRLQKDMELRLAEESRLANLIGSLQVSLSALDNQIESWNTSLSFLEEKEQQNSRNITNLQAELVEMNKRWGPVNERFDTLGNNIHKIQAGYGTLTEDLAKIRESMKTWMEQIQIGEYERNQKIEKWRQALEEQDNALDQFNRDWITFSDQYKEAKMAVQTLNSWQKQIEQQQHETSEVLRVGINRLETRWDNFRLENDKKWHSASMETEQHAANSARITQKIQEHIAEIETMIVKLQDEKDTIWRMQSAQADAIKKLPLIWLEEVDKAIKQNPNRRRQPALVPVREEFD